MAIEQARLFLDEIGTVYGPKSYRPAQHHTQLLADTPKHFTRRKQEIVAGLLQANGEVKNDEPKSYLSEWATYISIAEALDPLGYTTEMAPFTLEQGGVTTEGSPSRKGVDIIISRRTQAEPVPLLGINVKLRKLEPSWNERQRFDPKLCAPAITLSLGDWQETSQDQNPTNIREWITEQAVPHIKETGAFPTSVDLQQYIFQRIAETLDVYEWKVGRYVMKEWDINENELRLLPHTPEDFAHFYEKLTAAQRLFTDLAGQKS